MAGADLSVVVVFFSLFLPKPSIEESRADLLPGPAGGLPAAGDIAGGGGGAEIGGGGGAAPLGGGGGGVGVAALGVLGAAAIPTGALGGCAAGVDLLLAGVAFATRPASGGTLLSLVFAFFSLFLPKPSMLLSRALRELLPPAAAEGAAAGGGGGAAGAALIVGGAGGVGAGGAGAGGAAAGAGGAFDAAAAGDDEDLKTNGATGGGATPLLLVAGDRGIELEVLAGAGGGAALADCTTGRDADAAFSVECDDIG